MKPEQTTLANAKRLVADIKKGIKIESKITEITTDKGKKAYFKAYKNCISKFGGTQGAWIKEKMGGCKYTKQDTWRLMWRTKVQFHRALVAYQTFNVTFPDYDIVGQLVLARRMYSTKHSSVVGPEDQKTGLYELVMSGLDSNFYNGEIDLYNNIQQNIYDWREVVNDALASKVLPLYREVKRETWTPLPDEKQYEIAEPFAKLWEKYKGIK